MSLRLDMILVGVVAAGAAFLIGNAIDQQRTAKMNEVTAQRQGAQITATDGITADGSKADTAKAEDETAVTTGRQTYTDTMERAQREEPAIADRANRRVPDRVRDAARARRLARERSNGAEGER